MTSSRERVKAMLAATLAAKRAKGVQLPPDQEQAFWKEQEVRHQRATCARKAQRDGRRTPRPPSRASAPPPSQNKMWCKAISLDAGRDQRLSMGARLAVEFIRALLETGKPITRVGLAALMGVSARTAQRYISQLRHYGYITTRLLQTASGWVIGQMVELAAKVLPYFMRGSLEIRRSQGETVPPPNNSTSLTIGLRIRPPLPQIVGMEAGQ